MPVASIAHGRAAAELRIGSAAAKCQREQCRDGKDRWVTELLPPPAPTPTRRRFADDLDRREQREVRGPIARSTFDLMNANIAVVSAAAKEMFRAATAITAVEPGEPAAMKASATSGRRAGLP